MTEEISLSVEDTNKLRLQLGLKPISLQQEDSSPSSTTSTTTSQSTNVKKTSNSTAVYELSIEETNKLRLSLGLKPLDSEISKGSEQAVEVQNFNNHQEQKRRQHNDEKLKNRISDKRQENRNNKRLIQVSEQSRNEEPVDTDNWLANLGKPKTKKAKTSVAKTTQQDSSQVKIAHSEKELKNLHNNDILTLEDADILDENDDEVDVLTNQKLVDSSKLKKDLKQQAEEENIKFNGRHYQGRYDEDDSEDEKEVQGVMITTGSVIKLDNISKKESVKKDNRVTISNLFDESEDEGIFESNDFSKPKKPVKMKKMKKSKLSTSSNSRVRDDDIPTVKAVELETFAEDLVDEEDDLQSKLTTRRRLKQKTERSSLTPDQIASEIARNKRWDLEAVAEENIAGAALGGEAIVFNDTTEFLSSINVNGVNLKPDPESQAEPEISSEPPKMEEKGFAIKKENGSYSATSVTVNKEDDDNEIAEVAESDSGPKFNGGLAETLNFLQSRNILHKSSAGEHDQERKRREAARESELLKIKISIEERLLKEEFESSREYMNLPKTERSEIFDRALDQRLKEKNIVQDVPATRGGARGRKYRGHIGKDEGKLAGYNPKVKLSYRDNNGDELNTKEAFKYLSHQFHGVGPSIGKEEKRKKKHLEEKEHTTEARIV
ncbi:hypothetical protein G9P44_002701 [Scheffersomyces stipitis]|nr:hypothetical protein G9P44_002701 [Scheffersomyces stipitis]